MKPRYRYINSPIKIRNTTLKSRFIYPTAQPHFLQGPERYPADPVVDYYCSLAKNGAAMLLFHDLANDYQRSIAAYDIPHFAMYDMNDKGCQNYFSHFAHMVHFYGSKLCTSLEVPFPARYYINPDGPIRRPPGGYMKNRPGDDLEFSFGSLVGPEGKYPGMTGINEQAPKEAYLDHAGIAEYTNAIIDRMKMYQSFTFDAAVVPIDIMLQFYAADANHRGDEYGGSTENRGRFTIQVMERIRRAVGDDFILYVNAPTAGNSMGYELTQEEVVGFLKLIEPYVDVLYLRSASGDLEMDDSHAPGIPMAKELKAAGVKTPIAISTPYMELDKLEAVIQSGAADFIQSAHMFIANPDLGEIITEGRGEDLVPCILCHNCRGVSFVNDYMSHCTVNPRMGMEYRVDKMIAPVKQSKRVAIIGGGPAGMNAAIYLKKRGHIPVIFEMSDTLGGELKRTDCCDFKWRLNRYRTFLVNQMERNGIEVRLNTRATPEGILEEDFDAVIAALGGAPRMPAIEGVEHADCNIYDVFGNEARLGRRVVVVGGSAVSAEAAIYLARAGHDVTEISRKNIVAYELNPIRERGNVNRFSVDCGVRHIRSAKTTRIAPGKVWYEDGDGNPGSVECDSIVVSGGLEARRDESMRFFGCAREYYAIGDCREVGNLRSAVFEAYGVCMQI